jgi:hypothetical protein
LALGDRRLTDRLATPGSVLASHAIPALTRSWMIERSNSANPEHLEEGAAGWGGRVNRLPLKIEIAPDRAEFSEEPDKVLQRAPKPVNRPRRDNVNLVGGCRLQQTVEAGALFSTLGAADPPILELPDNPPAPHSHAATNPMRCVSMLCSPVEARKYDPSRFPFIAISAGHEK